MASSARLVTIKRSGDDGAHFPLSLSSCLFGRSIECDIRIQLPVVSKKHCKIEVNGQEAILYNFSSTNPTQVNGATIDEPVQLKHGDIITIIDRSFRYENGNHEDGSSSTGFPGKSPGQEPARRASRASFSVDPDGKGQDAKASKTTASRRSLVHTKRLSGDSSVSDGSKDSVTQDPSNTCSSGHVEQHSGRSTGEPTSGGLFKKSGATGSSYRELKSSPAQSLSNSKKNDSPFEKLYQSMKEELDIKSQKQSHRKSEPHRECVAGKDTWETKLLVSCKSRPKSSGSTPGTAASSPKGDKIGAETQSNGVRPVETSAEALNPSFPLSETAKMKTPVRNSQLLKNEDLHVTGRRESVNLGESEGAKAGHRIVTPRKMGSRNQTSVKVEDAASPADTPENLSSKKRRSIPAKVEVLSAETQNRFSSTQHLAPSEKKTPKDSFSKPEKLATAAEQICSGLPGLSSVDISNFGDSINKCEGMSVKRRRVSFGGRLRPELFDENLPPNTPLKRGETPTRRKSLATHTPAVLKKIIKERPQSPGKQESPGISPPKANDLRRRSGRSSPASSDSKSLHQTDTPKKAVRKSGNLPAKRASISRSQHDILQMICSKRRSGASEANLIVAKSWADVVKLGTKQTQTKVVKHVPQKQTSKRQRRPTTPKKPTSNLHNQFSTGHANSPCTIVVGRAQIEKVSMPARPYKMLNNLMLNRKMDFNEDLSGLTEMFKTPVKEKQQQMNDVGSILSNSENLPEKQFQVTNSGDKPLPITSETLGENVLSSTRDAAKEPSDKYSASPILRRRSIKSENTVQTPKNVPNITQLEKKTSGSVTEPLKTVSSVSKLRRSRELRHTLVESIHENTEADLAEGIKGRHLRKTSLQGQEVDRQVQNSENSSQRFKENVELKEDPEKTSAMRSSAREQKPTKDIIRSQMITQTAACAEELLNQEKGTTEEPEESMHMQNTPICDDQRAKKQKVELVYAAKVKRWSRTPDKKTQPLEGPASLKEPFETPNCRDKPIGDDKTKVLCKSPQPTTEKTKTSTKTRPSTSGKKVDMKEEEQSSLKTFIHMSGGTRHTSKVPELEHGTIKALKEPENQMLDVTVSSTKRPVGKAKGKAQSLEDLTGFQELFLSPVPGDKITKMPNKSPFPELVGNPASKRKLSKTGLDKVGVREEPFTLEKRTKSPGRATRTPTAPVLEESDTTALMETPKQKLDFTENSGSKRRSRTPKIRAQPLEDLDGFQELFQTPVGASDPVTVGETTKVSLECPQPEPVRTPASTKRLSKTGLDKVGVREEPFTLGKRTKSPGRATRTPTAPVLEESDTTALMETPKQKLVFTENSTGHKRRSQTPKIRIQPLEDLDDFQELFQTPVGASDPMTVGETTKVSLECPQPEPVSTPASTKRLSKTSLRKVDLREEPLTLGKRTKSPGRATRTPTAPVLEESDTTALMETPKQKLDFTENSGSKRRSRTPKIRAQPLEDLDGFQELFQTPVGASDPVTVGETTKVSLECPQPEPVRTPTSTKRLSKTGLDKVGVREEPFTLGKRTKSPGRATRTPTAPVLEESDTTALMETPKQKLVFTENSTGHKRRSQTPKIRIQPLEDLDDFQELFQTPVGASDPMTVGETTKVSLECPQPEPVSTPASTKRLSKTGLRKVDLREEPLTLGKRTKSPGRATRTPTAPVLEESDTTALMETPKQKLDFTENSGSKRRSRTPKIRAQPLEDLDGFQELFQTPVGASDPVTIGETTKVSLESLHSEPVRTPASTKRLSKTGLRKVDVREEPSTLGKRTKSPGRASRTPTAPVQQEKGIKAMMETSNQNLEPVGNLTGPKKQLRTPKEEGQSLEDLTDCQELFQTPDHGNGPLVVGKTKKMSFNYPPPEPVITLKSIKRQSRASISKTEVKEELSESEKHLQIEKAIDTLQVPDGNTVVRTSKQSAKRKLDPAASVPSSKRLRRASKDKTPCLEDLSGFQQLFQTPGHTKDSLPVGETLKMPSKPPHSGPVRSQTSRKSVAKISLRKMDMTELSALWKQSLGKAPTAPVQQDTGIQAIMKKTPKDRLESAADVTGLTGQRRAPKEKALPLGDLSGFQEVFQTPGHSTDPLIDNKITSVPLKSPQPGLIRTPQTSKRLAKTSLGKGGVREEISSLNVPGRATGEIVHVPRLPEDDGRGNKDLKESRTQTQGPSVSVTGSKKQRGAHKERSQSPEDLSGLQELFQTPASHKDSMTVRETMKMSLESSEPEHIRTPANKRRLSKTGLDTVGVREEPSTLGKRTKSPGRATRTPTAPVLEESDTTALMETPKQKLDFTENSGSKRRSRTPKIRAQPLEDLDGFQELFQTPVGASDPVTVGETTKVSLECPQPEPVRTPASTKRLSKTGLDKVGVREEPFTLGKRTKSPGRATRTPTAPVLEESDTTALMETPKQKLDFTENSGSKRRSRTPKIRAQPLEDLDGFQELFQTPVGASDPVTIGETTKVSLECPQPEPVRTPASTKRLSKTGLDTVGVREEPSTLGKRTKSPGRATHTPTAPVLEESDTTALMETPKQKLDFTENSGSKRRSRTPKIRAQPLEDLDGFQELFQTPVGVSDPVTVGETTKVSLECPQPESIRTPVSTKRLSKTGLDKVGVREKLSPLNKPRCSSQKVMHEPRLSEHDGRGTIDLKQSVTQTLDPAVSVTRTKRQRGACKKRSQSPEDLFRLQELFQTPGHDKDSVAGDKLTKMPHRLPSPEPVDTSVTSQRQPRTRLMKARVKSEQSGDRMLPQMSGEIMDISRVAEGEDKGIRTRKQAVKRKLDTAVSVPSSKRQRIAQAEKAQALEDLPSFQELYQPPSSAVDSVTVDKATKMSSKSPEPMDTTSKTQPGRRLRRVGVTKEPVAQRKSTRVLRETRNTHQEPVGDRIGDKEFKESSMQKQDPAGSLTGKRSQPRTHKEKTQPLEELPSIQEETATRMSCESPQPEEKETSAASKRQLRIRLCKVGVKEEPIAQRKPPGRETRSTLKEPMSDSGNVEELKESTKRKTDPAASVPVSKRSRRVPREKAQPLELAGPKTPVKIPGPTEESASDKRLPQMPSTALQPEQVDSLQTSPRRPRTRRGKVEVDEEPSVVRKTVPKSRQTTRSCKVPEIDDKDTQASKEPVKQKLETVANVTGSRRQLRAPKGRVQPLEVLGDSKEITEISEHTEELRPDTSKSTLQQMPDSIKPLRTCRRVLRASKEDTVETMKMLVDTRDPEESQSKSNTLLPPKRKSARDGSVSRTRGLRSVTPKQEATDEKPVAKTQRTAPSKRQVSPEPVKMKHLRIMSSKIEPVEEEISNIMKTEEKEAPPDQKMALPSRNRKKTNGKQPRPEVSASAETVGIKKNEKTMETSQETELQSTDDGAKKSTARDKVSGKRTCLRSRGQRELPQTHAAEEKPSETEAEILIKTQKKKGVSGDSDVRCLRSRKTGATSDTEPKPRVTRGTKKDTEVPKKDEDIVYTKKLRTRSHQNSKNM
ncbi:proliferation marker protein Ki-67 isoform X2 [Peromyscus californicus insignis]|uniref:proliferation marker protein Ki-67 isoform X2 n=1 Tax=Peromyscus californicus insignis TaxID=564181 RepID=UPI0022A7FEC3|nr:proliferation marker protein Ki-67 isoform X2 [Peromyscus californicus insignis]